MTAPKEEWQPIKAAEVGYSGGKTHRAAQCKNCTWRYDVRMAWLNYRATAVTPESKKHVARTGHIVETESRDTMTYYAVGSPAYLEAIAEPQ